MKKQKIITLQRNDGQFLNFFHSPNSYKSLQKYIDMGWYVFYMSINEKEQEGWLLLERIEKDEEIEKLKQKLNYYKTQLHLKYGNFPD
jgi:hypothetical protein